MKLVKKLDLKFPDKFYFSIIMRKLVARSWRTRFSGTCLRLRLHQKWFLTGFHVNIQFPGRLSSKLTKLEVHKIILDSKQLKERVLWCRLYDQSQQSLPEWVYLGLSPSCVVFHQKKNILELPVTLIALMT